MNTKNSVTFICHTIVVFCYKIKPVSAQKKNKTHPRNVSAFSGGVGGTRTLAPGISRPTPLAGAPRHQLEYNSMETTCQGYRIEMKWRREWDSNPRSREGSLVFKTSSLNHSDISPCNRVTRNVYYYITRTTVCQQFFGIFLQNVFSCPIKSSGITKTGPRRSK